MRGSKLTQSSIPLIKKTQKKFHFAKIPQKLRALRNFFLFLRIGKKGASSGIKGASFGLKGASFKKKGASFRTKGASFKKKSSSFGTKGASCALIMPKARPRVESYLFLHFSSKKGLPVFFFRCFFD